MRIATWNINSVRLRIHHVLRFIKEQKIVARLPLDYMTIKTHYAYAKWLRFLHDATYKSKVLADRNKSILRDYDNQIDLNFGLMKLCVGEFECELARNNQ